MICSFSSPAQRQYRVKSLIGAGLVLLLSMLAKEAFRSGHLHGALAYVVAALPALPIVWLLVLTGVYLDEEKDEFQRSVLVQSLLGGIGGTLATTTVWGFVEDFVNAPQLDLIWVYAIFWLFVCISYPIVRARYR